MRAKNRKYNRCIKKASAVNAKVVRCRYRIVRCRRLFSIFRIFVFIFEDVLPNTDRTQDAIIVHSRHPSPYGCDRTVPSAAG